MAKSDDLYSWRGVHINAKLENESFLRSQKLWTYSAIQTLALFRKPHHLWSMPLYQRTSHFQQILTNHNTAILCSSLYTRENQRTHCAKSMQGTLSSGSGGFRGDDSSGGGRSEGPATFPLAPAMVRALLL